ncbi:DUF1059 domain-containing protein [Methanococcoides sp. SA1]|nr:DUF1059 domain-containing protein [Methanococcoides sp. SA1]
MKIIKCRDLGFNCDFMATGSAAEADSVIEKMLVHIKEDHEGLSDEDLAEVKARMSVLLSRGCGCGAL